MARFIKLHANVSVCGQLYPKDIATVADAGFTTLVCNRPDNEVEDQPSAAQIEGLAKAAGLTFVNIPVGGMNMETGYVDRMAQVIEQAHGPVLAYCRSGLRCALLWALASVRKGADADAIIRQVEGAGFPTRIIRSSVGGYMPG